MDINSVPLRLPALQLEEYFKPRWRRQRLGLHHAQERVIERFGKKVVNGMKWVSRHHYHQERVMAVYLGAGNFSQSGWKAGAVRGGVPQGGVGAQEAQHVGRPDRLVSVDEFRTTVSARPCMPASLVSCTCHLTSLGPAGHVNQRLLRPAWSLRHAKGVRGLKWCHEVPPNPLPPPPAQHPPAQDSPAHAQALLAQEAPAQDPPAPPPAQEPPPTPFPSPGANPTSSGAAPYPGPSWPSATTPGSLMGQRIGESMQRPLELCSYEGLEALPPIGKENQQGYKRVNDRLPKVKQRLHRAAEYRRGIDGQARNNA
ncbi:hypothetical protein QJQ45_009483 [Haematococcus lacustris]|nr:hypothetical protein QJQ45_009483 [Haematococcus lacustris]